jgi:hypothetical protein
MDNNDRTNVRRSAVDRSAASSPRRVHAWLSPGQDWVVEIGGVEIVVRLVERRGRRARVSVEAQVQQPSLIIRSG